MCMAMAPFTPGPTALPRAAVMWAGTGVRWVCTVHEGGGLGVWAANDGRLAQWAQICDQPGAAAACANAVSHMQCCASQSPHRPPTPSAARLAQRQSLQSAPCTDRL